MPTRPPSFTLHKRDPKQAQREHDRRRGNSTQRGYDHAWREFRKIYLAKHPMCEACKAQGRLRVATDVDHITRLAIRPDLKYEPSNLQALCGTCHKRKTAREQHG